jgi:hypothetical protein
MESIPQWLIMILEIGAAFFLSTGEAAPPEPFAETNYQALVISSLCTEPNGKVILTYQEKGATSSRYVLVEYTATCLGGLPQSLLLQVDSPAHVNFLAADGSPLPVDYDVKANVPNRFTSEVVGEFVSFQAIPK